MTDENPNVFIDLKKDDFPFLVELLDSETRAVVWSQLVEEPGALVVPSKNSLGVGHLKVRLSFPDGTVETEGGDSPASADG